jgi:hypothetical protein
MIGVDLSKQEAQVIDHVSQTPIVPLLSSTFRQL